MSLSKRFTKMTLDSKLFVQAYIDAWNSGDADAVANYLSDDGTFTDVVERAISSRDEFTQELTQVFGRSVHRYTLIGDVVTGGSTIAFQYRVDCIDDENPSLIGLTWQGSEFIELNDAGIAVRITDYYQLPVLPVKQLYANSGLSVQMRQEIEAKATNLVETEQLFLDAALKVGELAERLAVSSNHLSQTLNQGFGQSFRDWINTYRVQYAKRLIEDNPSMAMIEIGEASGFGAPSTFYSAFRRVENMTPAQYAAKVPVSS